MSKVKKRGMKQLDKLVKDHLTDNGLTLTGWCRSVGVGRSWWYQFLDRDPKVVSPITWFRLGEALRLNPVELRDRTIAGTVDELKP